MWLFCVPTSHCSKHCGDKRTNEQFANALRVLLPPRIPRVLSRPSASQGMLQDQCRYCRHTARLQRNARHNAALAQRTYRQMLLDNAKRTIASLNEIPWLCVNVTNTRYSASERGKRAT
jgi:hypothetical protein